MIDPGVQNNSTRYVAELEKAETHKPFTNKDGLWCSYCKKPRHAKETSRKLQAKTQSSYQND